MWVVNKIFFSENKLTGWWTIEVTGIHLEFWQKTVSERKLSVVWSGHYTFVLTLWDASRFFIKDFVPYIFLISRFLVNYRELSLNKLVITGWWSNLLDLRSDWMFSLSSVFLLTSQSSLACGFLTNYTQIIINLL